MLTIRCPRSSIDKYFNASLEASAAMGAGAGRGGAGIAADAGGNQCLPLGAEWRAIPALTLRAGLEFNINPVDGAEVTLGLLAPAVTASQFSAGLSYRETNNSSIDLAGYYAPKGSVSGSEITPYGPTPGSNIAASLSEAQVTIGWTYHFDSDASVKAK